MFSIALSTLFGSRRIRTFSADPMRREFEAITPYIQAGTLRPEVGQVFPSRSYRCGTHGRCDKGRPRKASAHFVTRR